MTDEAMGQIRHARDLIAGQQWEELDALLASDLTPLPSPRLVGPLLATLVDDVAAEPHLFGVIHLAETADDSDYVAGLLEALPRLTQASPRWARILLVRVLNSPAALAELIAAAPHAPEPQQAAVALAAESVKAWRPDQFGERCAQVRGALSLSD